MLGIIARDGLEIRLDDRQQRVDLLDLEDAREPARETWRGDRTPRVARREVASGGPAMERPDGGQALRHGRAGATLAEDAQIGSQVSSRRASPVRAPCAEPVQVGTDGRGVGALRVRRGVARGEGAEEPREDGIGRLAGRLPAHASGAGSTGRVRLVVDRPPDLAPPRGRPPPFAPPPARGPPRARAGRARASGFGGPPGYLTPGTMSAAGVSLVEPQMRHIAASSLRASGPSSVSCRPPSGSWFVVKSQRG